ncbi:MAG: hypothetical protein QOE65_1283 [Solirubrobacteraceae bacterium]|nr:hypothetical protein [Solirubrobacteraceae bacterium]
MERVDRERLERVAAVLRADADHLAAEMGERAARWSPEWVTERPELGPVAFRVARAGFEAGLGALSDGRMPDACPEPDREFARVAAQLGVPVHTVLETYNLAHGVLWEAWFAAVERLEPDAAARGPLLQVASRFFFDYFMVVSQQVVERYGREREAALRSGRRRLHMVRDILEGGDGEPELAGYDLEASHLGLVAWGDGAAEAAEALAEAAGRRLLLVETTEGIHWGWLGGARPLDARARRALARFEPPRAARLALGVEAAGRDGFRRTHADARVAQRGAWKADRRVTFFDAVALEALAGADEPAAQRFVERELRGVDGNDARSRRLRDTLSAYFSHGSNAAATAKALGVHEQTVAHRLTAVERSTGRPVVERRAELETALRLRRYLSSHKEG